MAKYARIIDGRAVDVVDTDPVTLYHPILAAQFVQVPDDVVDGSVLDVDDTWTPPAVPDPVQPETPLEAARAAKLSEIQAKRDSLLAAGYPVAITGTTLHVEASDRGRTDLGGMAITALAAQTGALAWPSDYALGWITVENVRLPLPTAADGLALAAGVGGWYARLIQAARTLKDAALAAPDTAALAAIDADAGWPD